MGFSVRNVTFDCADPYELAQFWSQVMNRPIADDDYPGDPVATIALEQGFTLYFAHVPEGKRGEPRTDFAFDIRAVGGTSLQVEPIINR